MTVRAAGGCPDDLRALPDWQVLLNHFRYGATAGLVVLIAPDEECANQCKAEIVHELRMSGKEVLDAAVVARATLWEEGFPTVSEAAGFGAVWLSSGPWDETDSSACVELAARLNGIASPVTKGAFSAPCVLACPPWFRETLPQLAPDIWCVRTLVASVVAESASNSPVSSAPVAPTPLFVCYSHNDRIWLDRLYKFIKPLIREGLCEEWDDRRIRAGEDWRAEIARALQRVRAAILLVSQDFIASDFIANNELPPLLDGASQKGVLIIWVAVRYSMYRRTKLSAYQSANNPDRPLAMLRRAECDREMVAITEKIAEALEVSIRL